MTTDRARDELRDEISGWTVGSGYYSVRIDTDTAREIADHLLAAGWLDPAAVRAAQAEAWETCKAKQQEFWGKWASNPYTDAVAPTAEPDRPHRLCSECGAWIYGEPPVCPVCGLRYFGAPSVEISRLTANEPEMAQESARFEELLGDGVLEDLIDDRYRDELARNFSKWPRDVAPSAEEAKPEPIRCDDREGWF